MQMQQPLASKTHGSQAIGGLQADGRRESAATLRGSRLWPVRSMGRPYSDKTLLAAALGQQGHFIGGLQVECRQESAAAPGSGARAFQVQRCSAESQASDGHGQDHDQRQLPLASTVHGQALSRQDSACLGYDAGTSGS